MNSSDKKHMTWIVFIFIFLGIIMIFFLKPDYSREQIGAVSLAEDEKNPYTEDFGELIHEFEEPPYTEENFIKKQNKLNK